jgi:D-alanine-D-alanine ligase
VGITRVTEPDALASALEEAFRFERKAVVERAIEPVREIECAVLGNDDPVASVCGEIVPQGHDFYDYEAKYLDEHGAQLLIPAPLDQAVAAQVQRLAISAFTTVAGAGMARVDTFVREGEIWLNEINTIPGFTSISMYPKLWEASGLPYAELVQRLLDLAVERFEREEGKRVDVPELHGRDGGTPAL